MIAGEAMKNERLIGNLYYSAEAFTFPASLALSAGDNKARLDQLDSPLFRLFFHSIQTFTVH